MPLKLSHLRRYQDGFAIFALSVVVFSLVATTVLLAWQVSRITEPAVAVAPIELRVRTN
jgi:hypothetical protein